VQKASASGARSLPGASPLDSAAGLSSHRHPVPLPPPNPGYATDHTIQSSAIRIFTIGKMIMMIRSRIVLHNSPLLLSLVADFFTLNNIRHSTLVWRKGILVAFFSCGYRYLGGGGTDRQGRRWVGGSWVNRSHGSPLFDGSHGSWVSGC